MSIGIHSESCIMESQKDAGVTGLSSGEMKELAKTARVENIGSLEYPYYTPHRWEPSPNQHAILHRKPTHIVVHTVQGSYSGCIAWFLKPSSQVSSHYVVSELGHVTQMVAENRVAWHVREHNSYTIGVEHEGWIDDGNPPTDAQLHASAKIVAGACLRWDIPIDAEHIKGHRDYLNATHSDPGEEWPMEEYIELVRVYAKQEETSPKPEPIPAPDRAMFVYSDNGLAHTKRAAYAATHALRMVGIDADAYSGEMDANSMANLALTGGFGKNILVVTGTRALDLFAAEYKDQFRSSGEWLLPDKSNVWDARTDVVRKVRSCIELLCRRAGKDEIEAIEYFDKFKDETPEKLMAQALGLEVVEDEVQYTSFAQMVQNTWWLVQPKPGVKPFTTTAYKAYLWNGRYPYGCKNSRHHGIDVGHRSNYAQGMIVRNWAYGRKRLDRYDSAGYRRYVGMYYPSINVSVDFGHLLNGSTTHQAVGQMIPAGAILGRIGTLYDGINHSHVHIRAASGNWGTRAIPPCSDMHPIIPFDKLVLSKV